ncbi:MAG: ABC transporter ATP-binding protein [Candidatus Babeliaceae bacterium]
MNPLLKVENLTKQFGPYRAVDKVSFSLYPGEILGLLGANGAGKTTIIQMLLSTLKPTSGSIVYFDQNFFAHRSEILQKVSFASTYVKLPGDLTIYENLTLYGKLYGLSGPLLKERIERFLNTFGMWQVKDRKTVFLSAGETTRVMLAKAFLTDPQIVLLDEPTAALDPDIAHEVRAFILAQQKERKIGVLITSHNMDEVTQVCDRVMVMQKGVIIADDAPEKLAATVATARLEITLAESDITQVMNFALQKDLVAHALKHGVVIEIDEHQIADFLIKLAQAGIIYTHISIDKPSLEDYFLSIVKKAR